MNTITYIFIGGFLVLIFYFIAIFNNLIRLKNQFKNAFSQIDVQLKRRYDLIPNLVETAKGYMKHERETLEAVIKARGNAESARKNAARDPGNQGSMQQLMEAEASLSGILGRLFALSESYPELKADQTIRDVMEELKTTENRIAFSRQAYNDSVMSYNTAMEVFPNNFVANLFAFKQAGLWTSETKAERQAVKVSF
ncbi:MAG: LemA family protein [Gammaproteobacteria bacterium]|nr:LemA family protein [Gammaproteobacteria bacterium]